MAIPSHSLKPLSPRHLLGSGFGQALEAHFGRRARATALAASVPLTWGEVDSTALGARLAPARTALLEATGVAAGTRLLDVSAGDGTLALEAAAAGASVTALEPDDQLAGRGRRSCTDAGVAVDWRSEAPAADGGFDAVVSCFAGSHGADQRRLARLMTRSAAPGGAIALTAWKGLMATVMQIAAPERHGRSEHWSRHEIAREFFGDLGDLSVRQHFMSWPFADAGSALAELSAPVRSATGRRRLRDAMPDLVEMYGRHCESGLTLRADYVVIFARRR